MKLFALKMSPNLIRDLKVAGVLIGARNTSAFVRNTLRRECMRILRNRASSQSPRPSARQNQRNRSN